MFLFRHVNGRLYAFWLQPTGGEADSADYTGTCCRQIGQGKVLIRVTLGCQRLRQSKKVLLAWWNFLSDLKSVMIEKLFACLLAFDLPKNIIMLYHVLVCFLGGSCWVLAVSFWEQPVHFNVPNFPVAVATLPSNIFCEFLHPPASSFSQSDKMRQNGCKKKEITRMLCAARNTAAVFICVGAGWKTMREFALSASQPWLALF